jgi:hypothetical protein
MGRACRGCGKEGVKMSCGVSVEGTFMSLTRPAAWQIWVNRQRGFHLPAIHFKLVPPSGSSVTFSLGHTVAKCFKTLCHKKHLPPFQTVFFSFVPNEHVPTLPTNYSPPHFSDPWTYKWDDLMIKLIRAFNNLYLLTHTTKRTRKQVRTSTRKSNRGQGRV